MSNEWSRSYALGYATSRAESVAIRLHSVVEHHELSTDVLKEIMSAIHKLEACEADAQSAAERWSA